MKSALFFLLGLLAASNYPYVRDATLTVQKDVMHRLNNPPPPTSSQLPE